MAALEDDSAVSTTKVLTAKDYSNLLTKLGDHLTRKHVKKIKFLCYELVGAKNFLAKEDITAKDIFTEMDRNGSISRKNVAVLSQLMNLVGMKKLQREQLISKGFNWTTEEKSLLCEFRYMLYNLYLCTRKEDLVKMSQYCELRGDIQAGEIKDIDDALDLFTTLINHEVIAKNNVEVLCSLIESLNNAKMNDLVKAYKDKLETTSDVRASTLGLEEAMDTMNIGQNYLGLGSSFLALRSPETYMNESGTGGALRRPAEFSLPPSPPIIQPQTDLSRTNFENNRQNVIREKQIEGACGIQNFGKGKELTEKTAEIAEKIKIVASKQSEESGNSFKSLTDVPSLSGPMSNLDVHSGMTSRCPSTLNNECAEKLTVHLGQENESLPSKMDTSYKAGGDSAASAEKLKGLGSELNYTARTEGEQKQIDQIKMAEATAKSGPIQETNIGETTLAMRSVHKPGNHGDPINPDDRYKMTKKPRGICLILTYEKFDDGSKERKGNQFDKEKLVEVFGNVLHFDVVEKSDLTLKQTKQQIRDTAQHDKHGDSLVVIVCSHGDGASFKTKDGGMMKIQDLLTCFKPDNCKSLRGKPKIFFINTCLREKGTKFQEFVEADVCSDGPESIGMTAKFKNLWAEEADFFISLSTVPGYSSARDTSTGSFFIQHLCDDFVAHYMTEHLGDILVKVRKSMDDEFQKRRASFQGHKSPICQVSPSISGLCKKVYFNQLKVDVMQHYP